MSDEHAHEPSEVTYAEYFHPARPKSLRYRTRVKQSFERHTVKTDGQPKGTNPAYVSWLLEPVDARRREHDRPAVLRPGQHVAEPVRQPGPAAAVESASVWFTAYPISLITRPGESFLASLGDEELWKAFATIGIDALHTGPVKQAGGLDGWRPTPSVDGHFDRISTRDRPGVRHRGRVPRDVRHGRLVRRHDHRRHRARPHRQGRRLPARRDEATATTPASTTWSRSSRRTGTCCPTSRPGSDSVNLDTRDRGARCRRPATSSAGCSG